MEMRHSEFVAYTGFSIFYSLFYHNESSFINFMMLLYT